MAKTLQTEIRKAALEINVTRKACDAAALACEDAEDVAIAAHLAAIERHEDAVIALHLA